MAAPVHWVSTRYTTLPGPTQPAPTPGTPLPCHHPGYTVTSAAGVPVLAVGLISVAQLTSRPH